MACSIEKKKIIQKHVLVQNCRISEMQDQYFWNKPEPHKEGVKKYGVQISNCMIDDGFRLNAWDEEENPSYTLKIGLHEIPTMIRTFPHGLEKNHACKWTSDNFPGTLTYVLFLENYQTTICMNWYSPIHVDRSSNQGLSKHQKVSSTPLTKVTNLIVICWDLLHATRR